MMAKVSYDHVFFAAAMNLLYDLNYVYKGTVYRLIKNAHIFGVCCIFLEFRTILI